MNIIRRIIFFITLLLFVFTSNAQRPENDADGKISGRLIDSISGKPVDYASISLSFQGNDKVVNGVTSDTKGNFALTNVADGTYKVSVYFIGYKTYVKNNIVVGGENTSIVLGDIKLVSTQTKLKAAEISAEKSLVEYKIDKVVFNAENDITSQGGVATDILKKVPQVSVDVDGTVELQGNSNIRFLINGKPSTMFGNNIADVLQSIPASQIQSIEAITSPGAKYDAQGTGGIINIILKKNKAQGFNGSVSLSAGTRLENGSLNIGARRGKFGVNAFFSGNAQLTSTTITSLDRLSQDPLAMQSSRLLQNGTGDFNRNGFETGIEFDWEISPKDNITAALGGERFENNNSGVINRRSILMDASGNSLSDINNRINTNGQGLANAFDYSFSYTRKFDKEDQELEFVYDASNGGNFSHYKQTQKYLIPDSLFSGSYGNNPGIENEKEIELNYTQPVGEDVVIETGAKAFLTHVKSTSEVFLLNLPSDTYAYNTNQSLALDYNSNVFAGYLSGDFPLFDFFDVKAGCRFEHTDINGTSSNAGTVNIKPYDTWVPSGILSHTFEGHQTLKISYTHRIERPEFRDLNPFVNLYDPKNITTGNPYLRPEQANNFELVYNRSFEKGASIMTTLYYRGNIDDIQAYTTYYPSYKVGDSTYTNVAVSRRENIGKEDNIGLSIYASVPVTKKISLRTNSSCYQRYITNIINPGNNISGFMYRGNLNITYQVDSTLSIEIFGNFSSRKINAQGKMPSATTYNFAFRKQFYHKKASIAVTATNPFNKYIDQRTDLSGLNFTSSSLRQLPYRSFGINFTYKFGKLEFKKEEKEPEDTNLTKPPEGN